MGKKTDQTENDSGSDTQTGYSSNYGSYQNSDAQYRTPVEISAPRAVTESESLARDIKEGTLSGYVGNGTVLTGETTFKAMLRVDGQLSGQISSDSGTLIVGTQGKVEANIEVAVAMIHGTVNGDIIASQRLELGRAAKVTGNIQTPTLVIEQGAIFEGSCRMIQAKALLEKKVSIPVEDVIEASNLATIADDTSESSDYSSYSATAS
jgi:cytoskeletal protein CcmA (bactofilin family)